MQFGNAFSVTAGGAGGAGSYTGSIKSWNREKGWGFIECLQTQKMFGKDIFIMKSALSNGTGQVNKGEQVTFQVTQGQKGPEAANVQQVGFGGGAPAAGFLQQMQQMGAPPQLLQQMQQMTGMQGGAQAQMGKPGQTHFGSIKSFNEEKGWGHIDCDATRKIHGKDMFVMRSALNGQTVQIGDVVTFAVGMGTKGPQAQDVTVVPAGSLSWDGQPGKVFQGVVKNWNPEKGWGFVTSPDVKQTFGKDIFLNKAAIGDYVPTKDEQVRFSVTIDEQGRGQAVNVSMGTFQAQRPAANKFRATPY